MTKATEKKQPYVQFWPAHDFLMHPGEDVIHGCATTAKLTPSKPVYRIPAISAPSRPTVVNAKAETAPIEAPGVNA